MAQELAIQVRCTSCLGTGVYVGWQEKKGEGVLCTTCKGSGSMVMKFTTYTGRVPQENVETVIVREWTGDSWGPPKRITYQQFLDTVPEEPVHRHL